MIHSTRKNSHNKERHREFANHRSRFIGQGPITKRVEPRTERRLWNALRSGAVVVKLLRIEGAVELEAESLYEAAVLAIRTFRQHDCEPGQASKLEVEVRSSVIHTITPMRVHEWLNGGAKTPREAVTKERLRALL